MKKKALTLREILKRIRMRQNYKDITVLCDAGHGENCKGKHSPDFSLYEWRYARDIAAMVVDILRGRGIDARLLVTETWDVPLATRVRRANAVCDERGAGNVLLVSIHNNASGSDGEWHTANGWQCHICKNASDNSKRFASLLYRKAGEVGLKLRRPLPTQDWWEDDFYILKHSKCPAVLTENLFQDNRDDVTCLLSREGKGNIVKLHVEAIEEYLRQ